MATKKKVVTTEVVDEADDETRLEIPLEPVDTEADPLQELINEAGEDGTIYTVKKIGGKPGEPTGYCAKYSAAELSLDVIRDSFGPGKYQIIGRDSQSRYVGSKTVQIIESARPAQTHAAQPQVMTPADMLLAMQQQTQALVQALKPTGPDPILIELVRGMAARPVPVAPPGPTIMEMLALMKEMRPDNSSAKESIDLLMRGLELGKELGGGGGDDSMMGLASKAMEMIPALAAAQPQQPTPNPRPQLPRPQPAPGITSHPEGVPAMNGPAPAKVAPVATPEGDPMFTKLNWLRVQTRALLNQAARGKDPGLYAEVMLDNLPPYIGASEILERMKSPTAIDDLTTLVPEVANHRVWFESFRVAVVDFLEGNEDDDGDTDDAPEGDPLGIDP